MRTRPTIRAITLDLDDTLWPIWPTIKEAEKHLYRWLQKHAPNTATAIDIATLKAAREKIEELYPQRKHDLNFYRRESIRILLKEHGDDEALAEEGFQAYLSARQNVALYDDVIPALEQLSAHYPIVGITNGNACLKTIGLQHFFKDSISAQSFGVRKPEKAIFLEAQRVLDVSNPEQILHIGDDFKLDVLGAKQVGFQTVWLKRPELNIPDVEQSALKAMDYFAEDLADLCGQLELI